MEEGSQESTFSDGDSNATCLLVSKHDSYLIAGYQDGKIRICDFDKRELIATVNELRMVHVLHQVHNSKSVMREVTKVKYM